MIDKSKLLHGLIFLVESDPAPAQAIEAFDCEYILCDRTGRGYLLKFLDENGLRSEAVVPPSRAWKIFEGDTGTIDVAQRMPADKRQEGLRIDV